MLRVISRRLSTAASPATWNVAALQVLVNPKNACQSDLTKLKKQEALLQYQRAPNDFGSSEAQIAMLSVRIKALTSHVQTNKKDKSSLRALLTLVSQRRGLLRYLKRSDYARYLDIREKLQLPAV